LRPILITRSPKKECVGAGDVEYEICRLWSGRDSGDGILNYQGKSYPFSISGLSLVDVGISNFTGAGKVYDLKSPRDLAGTYGLPGDLCVAGGASAMSMKNENGVSIVILKNDGQESGTQFSASTCGHEDHDEA